MEDFFEEGSIFLKAIQAQEKLPLAFNTSSSEFKRANESCTLP
jgi:hypothetical protein